MAKPCPARERRPAARPLAVTTGRTSAASPTRPRRLGRCLPRAGVGPPPVRRRSPWAGTSAAQPPLPAGGRQPGTRPLSVATGRTSAVYRTQPRPPRPAGGHRPATRPPTVTTGSTSAMAPTRPGRLGRRVQRAGVSPTPVRPRSLPAAGWHWRRHGLGSAAAASRGRAWTRHPSTQGRHWKHLGSLAEHLSLGSTAAASRRRPRSTNPPTVMVLTPAHTCHWQHVGHTADTASAAWPPRRSGVGRPPAPPRS